MALNHLQPPLLYLPFISPSFWWKLRQLRRVAPSRFFLESDNAPPSVGINFDGAGRAYKLREKEGADEKMTASRGSKINNPPARFSPTRLSFCQHQISPLCSVFIRRVSLQLNTNPHLINKFIFSRRIDSQLMLVLEIHIEDISSLLQLIFSSCIRVETVLSMGVRLSVVDFVQIAKKESVSKEEPGAKDISPYDVYSYNNIPRNSMPHVIRLRTGNVVFNYKYYNNILQRSEVTEDYSCPFCLVKCASYKGLKLHLVSSHEKLITNLLH
ncbi:hypothetical protein LXL04_033904 [Taraxacum kok-saghyz]